jgi:hypothetical protein
MADDRSVELRSPAKTPPPCSPDADDPANARPSRSADRRRREAATGATARGRALITGLVPAVLAFIWLGLAFDSGGSAARDWLLRAALLSAVGLTLALVCAWPRRPGQLGLAVLGAFLLYTLWVLLSVSWAASLAVAWGESGRVLFYLTFFALALAFLTARGARLILRWLLLGAALLLVGAAVARLWEAGRDLSLLFVGDRFSFPVGDPNGAAALYLLLFWPLIGAAVDPSSRVPVRGLSLGAAAGLLELAVLTQSRGGLWALAITGIFFVAVTPRRLRTLFYLLPLAALLVYSFPGLNRYWLEGVQGLSGSQAAWSIGLSLAVGTLIGLVLASLEGWVHVSPRMRSAFGLAIVVALLGGAAYGYVLLEREVGDPTDWLAESWVRFRGEQRVVAPGLETDATTRFAYLDSGGRWELWRVAWSDYRASPLTGSGAGSFSLTWERDREAAGPGARHPHSLAMRLLAETGIVGALLLLLVPALALAGALYPRLVTGWHTARRGTEGPWGDQPKDWVWTLALLAGFSYWLLHGSVEGLWFTPGVTLGALLLLALAVAETEARVGVFSARLSATAARLGPGSKASDLSRGAAEEERPTGRDSWARDERSGRGFSSFRRSDRHAARVRRRSRRERRRERTQRSMQPPGPLSVTFRWLLAGLCLLLFVAVGPALVSLLLQERAMSQAATQPERAADTARRSALLQPRDPQPRYVEANAFRALGARAGSRQALLQALAAALSAHEDAVRREPASWAPRYLAAVAALDLLAAQEPDRAVTEQAEKWAELARALPASEDATEQADDLLGAAELLALARGRLLEAQERSPTNREVRLTLAALP